MQCKAVRQCDEMRCDRCGLLWDVTDRTPPKCATPEQLAKRRAQATLDELKQKLR